MNKTYKSCTREVVFRVYQQCLAEQHAGEILLRLDDARGRTAIMTGVSETTVWRIIRKGIANNGKFETPGKHRGGRPKKEFDDFQLSAIRQKVQFFYTVEKEVPTLRKLLRVVKADLSIDCSHEHLWQILIALGFKFKKCMSSRNALIEKPMIAAKGEFYLKSILENRNLPEEPRKNVIYVDESYIHSSYKVSKCWQSLDIKGVKQDVSKGKRWIIVHAGSTKGFVPNALLIFSGKNKQEDYHSEMNTHNFTKWVNEKLIPNLHKPSIIVMDNAPYHSEIINKVPTSASKVADIKQWLFENNIQFDATLRKPSLLMLVKKHKPEPKYYIDELLGEYGHLNPIELIWAMVKRRIAERNVGGQNIKDLAENAFNTVTPAEWEKCCNHVVKIEKEYYERGSTLYEDIDRLVIHVSDDDSSSEESEQEEITVGLEDDDGEISGVEYLESDFSYSE